VVVFDSYFDAADRFAYIATAEMAMLIVIAHGHGSPVLAHIITLCRETGDH
jgi:hypothetical protein